MPTERTNDYDRKVARRIESVINTKKENQSWLARLFGITPAGVNKRYKIENPRYSIGEVLVLCEELDIQLDELIFDCLKPVQKDSFRHHLAQVRIAIEQESNPEQKLAMIRKVVKL